MGTFIQIIIVVYIFYYAGNIFYDLFLKKEKLPQEQEDNAEFSLGQIAPVNVTNVDMDKVEELQTSSSMEISEDEIFSDKTSDDSTDLEALKRKYDEETNLEEPSPPTTNEQNGEAESENSDKENVGGNAVSTEQPNTQPVTTIDKNKITEENRKRFSEMMKIASTSVQIVRVGSDRVFKSTMNFKKPI